MIYTGTVTSSTSKVTIEGRCATYQSGKECGTMSLQEIREAHMFEWMAAPEVPGTVF